MAVNSLQLHALELKSFLLSLLFSQPDDPSIHKTLRWLSSNIQSCLAPQPQNLVKPISPLDPCFHHESLLRATLNILQQNNASSLLRLTTSTPALSLEVARSHSNTNRVLQADIERTPFIPLAAQAQTVERVHDISEGGHRFPSSLARKLPSPLHPRLSSADQASPTTLLHDPLYTICQKADADWFFAYIIVPLPSPAILSIRGIQFSGVRATED